MEKNNENYTFGQFLKDHFGMPKDATVWRPIVPIEGETPADYGKETWEDVYYGYDGYLEPEHPVRRYFDDPWTEECREPWDKALAVLDGLVRLGAIDEDTRDNIMIYFCDHCAD